MPQYISILRGINVGGKRKILMKELKELFLELGYENIETYIQSGNVIFEGKEAGNNLLEEIISKAIQERFGYDVPVIVRSSEEWKAIISANPFTNEDINKLHITILKDKPSKESIASFQGIDYTPDEMFFNHQQIYIHCEGHYHKSKLSNSVIESKLKVPASTRNWKTIHRIAGMLK